MWFKNLTLYHLEKPFEWDVAELEQELATRQSRDCGQFEETTLGWYPPIQGASALTHSGNGRIVIAARKLERLLPASVVRDAVNDRVIEIEQSKNRKVGRKEKRELREEIHQQMLPKAFSRSQLTYIWIDPELGWIGVDSPSVNRSEEIISLLRETLGSLPVNNFVSKRNPADVMSKWVLESKMPKEFSLEAEGELRGFGDNSGIIKYRNLELDRPAIQEFLDNGNRITRLAVSWQGGLTFLLDQDMVIRRIKLLDMLSEQLDDEEWETEEERFDVDFILMSEQFAELIPAVIKLFGGLA